MFKLENYTTVNANSVDATVTYTPANNENIYLTMISGDAATSSDVKACLGWNNVCIFTTHNSNTQTAPIGSYLYKLEGDGSKQLVIQLTNSSSQSETIGIRIIGEVKYGS